MSDETEAERSDRILRLLRTSYPGKRCYDVDGHEPADEESGYDKAVEVIITSAPHRHERTTQRYTVLAGTLELHVNDASILLHEGDTYTIEPKTAHWATSEDEAVVEICSKPGWTVDDHLHWRQPNAPRPD
jgi:quercetin dioxygenase-like cupin family protein